MRNARAVKSLDQSLHPYGDHARLVTMPRRMNTRDVGNIGLGCRADSDSNITGDVKSLPTPLRPECAQPNTMRELADSDDNPFGFSLGLDEA